LTIYIRLLPEVSLDADGRCGVLGQTDDTDSRRVAMPIIRLNWVQQRGMYKELGLEPSLVGPLVVDCDIVPAEESCIGGA
jgi:hypothetical protein